MPRRSTGESSINLSPPHPPTPHLLPALPCTCDVLLFTSCPRHALVTGCTLLLLPVSPPCACDVQKLVLLHGSTTTLLPHSHCPLQTSHCTCLCCAEERMDAGDRTEKFICGALARAGARKKILMSVVEREEGDRRYHI